jgi:hypothetical protein
MQLILGVAAMMMLHSHPVDLREDLLVQLRLIYVWGPRALTLAGRFGNLPPSLA